MLKSGNRVRDVIRGARSYLSLKKAIKDGFSTVPRPMIMVWESTFACNLSCRNCYTSRDMEKSRGELDTGEIKQIITDAFDIGLFCLVISGGEPLLRDDIFNVASFAREQGLFLSLTTNGTLISDNIMEKLRIFDHVTVSLDDAHSMSVPMKDHHSIHSYNVFEYLKKLRAGRPCPQFSIQCVVDSDEVQPIAEYSRRIYEEGFDTTFQLLKGASINIEKQAWRNFIRSKGSHNIVQKLYQRRYLDIFPDIASGNLKSPCLPLLSNFAVSPEGFLLACNFERKPLGDLRATRLKDLWYGLTEERAAMSFEKRRCSCANSCFTPLASLLL